MKLIKPKVSKINNPNISTFATSNLPLKQYTTDDVQMYETKQMVQKLKSYAAHTILNIIFKVLDHTLDIKLEGQPLKDPPNDLSLSSKRLVLRNIKIFLKQTNLTEVVQVANGLYSALSDTVFEKYLGQSAFEEYAEESILCENRKKVYTALSRKVPSLKYLPNSNSLSSSHSNFDLKKEDISQTNAIITSFILPLVFTSDSLLVFLEEEFKESK